MSAKNWVLLYLVSLMWGTSFMFHEFILNELPPLTLVSLRLTIGAIVLMLLLGNWRHRFKLLGYQWARCFGFGLLSAALPFGMYAYGQLYVNSSTAAVINATMPIFAYAFAIVFAQDRLDGLRIAGILLGCVGVAILINAQWQLSYQELLGALICLGAPISYGLSAVLIQRYAGNLDSSSLSFGAIAAAAILALITTSVLEQPNFQDLSWQTWLSAICLGVFGTGLAFKLYYFLISEIGASKLSLVAYLIPINALPLGVLVLNEELSWNFYLGALIILLSIIMASGTKFSSLFSHKNKLAS